MDTSLPLLLTPQDVGLWLVMPTGRVIRLARQGKIPCIELPTGELVFEAYVLRRWLEDLRAAQSSAQREAAHA